MTPRGLLPVALLALLLAGACGRPAGPERAATATIAPSTSTLPGGAQDTEALRRAQLEVERLCMTEFPDHCAGVALVMGQAATAIKVEPVGKKPSPQELAGSGGAWSRPPGGR